MALTEYDKQTLNPDQQKRVQEATKAWESATTQADRDAAHAAAQKVRAEAGYQGGIDGNYRPSSSGGSADGVLLGGASGKTGGSVTEAPQNSLSEDLQSQIKELQEQWAKYNAEGNQAGMDEAHRQAELLRMSAGFSGGADGSANIYLPQQQRAANYGGYTAEQVARWVNDYKAANSDGLTYHNGYSPDMNLRSIANFVRQQMKANSDAWAEATDEEKAYLHEQNVQLAQILSKGAGGVQSTYNPILGRWETEDANLGYGYYTGAYNDPEWAKNVYGMTDEQMEAYRNDTDRYRNYVDQSIVRNWYDESSGYTGRYAQFVNGPYFQWLMADAIGRPPMSTYADLVGDGFGHGEGNAMYEMPKDAYGNLVQIAPALKNNNASDYTKSKAAYVDEYGIIQPGILDGKNRASSQNNMWLNGGTYVEEPWEHRSIAPTAHVLSGGSFTMMDKKSAADSYEDYINKYFDADLQAKMAQLQEAYNQSLAELDRKTEQNDAGYTEQRRQTTGDAERQMAAWREIANAQGLNSGAIGQSQLASSGQLQSNLNTINAAQATAQSDIANQRAILAQMYQLQIQQAQAENDYERAQQLYNEAVRVDESLREQEQFNAQMGLSFAQLLMGG